MGGTYFALAAFAMLGFLVTLTFLVIALANGKKKGILIFSISSVVLFGFGVFGFSYSADETSNSLKDAYQKAKDITEQEKAAEYAEHLVVVDSLKALLPPEIDADAIPEFFYEEGGMYPDHRFPMMYPYALEFKSGSIGYVTNFTDTVNQFPPLINVVALNFDGRFMVCKIDNYPEGVAVDTYDRPPFSFVLFEFYTEQQQIYQSKNELFDAALSKGYQGRQSLYSNEAMFNKIF